ncbi:L-lactate permease [Treponema pedis]|uniref:L-lactate permease n=1 Tax=Treponema pedis TaxID=409322 RepID=UPI000467BCDC|nr:L-lactate permease [Treponema pedis]
MLFLKFALAIIPIVWLIVSLSRLKMPSHKACGIALIITFILAISYWKLSVVNTSTAAAEGVLTALWPICLVIIAALFTYNLTVHTNAMDTIKKMLAGISDDKRILMLMIGWGFGNFMEGMAGFGTAMAIPASMLAGIGVDPIQAVTACLVANTMPTAFGSVGVPTATLAQVSGLELAPLAANVALIEGLITFISPFLMIIICGGGIKALKGVMGITLTASLSFVVPWFITAQFLGAELPDIIGSTCSILCMIAAIKLFKNKPSPEYSIGLVNEDMKFKISSKDGLRAWMPFILILVFLIVTSTLFPVINKPLSSIKSSFKIYSGEGGKALSFIWINTPGILIFAAAIIGGLIQKASIAEIFKVFLSTLKKYWKTVFTICAVIAIAKIMTYSGMISDIANMLVVTTGSFYPFVSPFIGVLGAFITGSGTSSCVLFGKLQQETAVSLSLNPYWITAANVMGAGIGKMVCPQGIAIGTSAINAVGSESKILSAVFKYFIFYTLLACIICFAGAWINI